jgi:hypothetical protein
LILSEVQQPLELAQLEPLAQVVARQEPQVLLATQEQRVSAQAERLVQLAQLVQRD